LGGKGNWTKKYFIGTYFVFESRTVSFPLFCLPVMSRPGTGRCGTVAQPPKIFLVLYGYVTPLLF